MRMRPSQRRMAQRLQTIERIMEATRFWDGVVDVIDFHRFCFVRQMWSSVTK